MVFDPVSALFEMGSLAIERFWPDPIKRAEEIRKLEEIKQTGDLTSLEAYVKILIGQLDINKTEAQNASILVAGWRPFIGWVGGFAIAYQFLVYPLLTWLMAILGYASNVPPPLDTGLLFSLVTGILGIGGMRSFDKLNGIATTSFR